MTGAESRYFLRINGHPPNQEGCIFVVIKRFHSLSLGLRHFGVNERNRDLSTVARDQAIICRAATEAPLVDILLNFGLFDFALVVGSGALRRSQISRRSNEPSVIDSACCS